MNKYLNQIVEVLSIDEKRLIKIHELEDESYDIISIRNPSKDEVSIRSFMTLYKILTWMKAHDINYSLSFQYKTDYNGIHHFDISINK
ncbi:hypothetical protein ACMGE5_06630 [Macrococcus equi]|uniref:hypothetical protein n=1 Tax=Macrococcus equi TaxID=3395462 RepID=UPI0039BE9ECA